MAGFKHVTIIGVGLIGGSLGLALKQRGLADEVVGVGHRAVTLKRARRRGAIDRWTLDVADGVADADLVVVCTPAGLVADMAAQALPAMKPGSTLTDVASTKAAIVRAVGKLLPKGVAFVPGHPMAGSEKRGIDHADAGLFERSVCILTPTRRTPAKPLAAVRRMWERVGASVETLTPARHDRVVAEISHLPHLIAPSLLNAAATGSLPFAGRGMKDATRIGGSDPDLWIDIFRDNREEVLRAAGQFVAELEAACVALKKSDWDALRRILQRARQQRDRLEHGRGKPKS